MPHVYIGTHPDVLGDGTPLAIDQVIRKDIDFDDPHNAHLRDSGVLIETEPKPKRQTRTRQSRSTTEEAK